MKNAVLSSAGTLRAAFVLTLLLSTTSTLVAGPGKISGTIKDKATGEPLIGANITVTHRLSATGVEEPLTPPMGAASGVDGFYFVLNVQSGTYTLRASMIGYVSVIQTIVRVESDRTIFVNFEMTPTTVEMESVTITAERATIKPDVSSTQEVIGTSRLERMPVTRVDEFVNKLKGVELVSGADGNGLSVRGGSIRETDIRLDGMSLQDPRSENAYLALNSTTIQEIQVLTGGFSAKYGGIRSGLLNVVTKDGSRERFGFSFRTDVAPAGQKHFFGTNPWSSESWVYRVFAGEFAWRGVPTGDTVVPNEFRTFKGWAPFATPNSRLDSLQKYDLWQRQHPMYPVAAKPDIFIEGSLTGPLGGAGIPLIGPYVENTTFLIGVKYEDSQLAFPIGPRDNYVDWNTQLKLTTNVSSNMRLSINGMYAKVSTVSGGATTSYGGALVDPSSSFSFLNSTSASVNQQARLIAGENLWQIFNKSRLQFYDQQYFVGGAKFTHTLSNTAFYTVDLQVGYTDQQLQPFALDTNRSDAWISYSTRFGTVRYVNAPTMGSPNASTNPGFDPLNMFRLYGGMQRFDSSYSTVLQLKGDLTMQVGRYHQIETGFSIRHQNLFVYSGGWLQAQLSYEPNQLQYFTAQPIDAGLYLQDKLEFEGMVMNAGVRVDYFNPQKKGFAVGFPLDDDYPLLYNEIYQNLKGNYGSYERWLAYRDLLSDPPGWPRTENNVQIHISPRLGVSFPVTDASKLYFNYGHFYQRPPISFMYDLIGSGDPLPTPGLLAARTVSYEFGYEHMLFDEILFNVTAYYKDVRNEPLSRTYYNYYKDNVVTEYVPDAYGDIRGIEFRLERPVGRYIQFHGMFDYLLQTRGQSGLSAVYENLLEAQNVLRSANIARTDPRPRGNMNVTLFTPPEWGLVLGDWVAGFFYEWKDGGKILWNPDEADIKKRIYVDIIDTWNIDFRGSKAFRFMGVSWEFVATVKNLTNNKWLVPGNMLKTQYDAYKASLRLPHEGGGDEFGQWKSDDGHIDTGWWDAPIFLNPRRIILGLRVNI